MELVEKFRYIRTEQNISQQKLGDMANIPMRTIQAWEYNRTTPTIDNFNKALKILGYELTITKIEQ